MSAQSAWPSINQLKPRIVGLRDIYQKLDSKLGNNDDIPKYRDGALRRLQGDLNGTKAQMRQTFSKMDPAKVVESTDYDNVKAYKDHLHEKIDKLKLFVDALCAYFGDDDVTEWVIVQDTTIQYDYEAVHHPFPYDPDFNRRDRVPIDAQYTFPGELWLELDDLNLVICTSAEKVKSVANQFPDYYWERLHAAQRMRDEVCWDHA